MRGPFDLTAAAHLARRAGFGERRSTLERWVAGGIDVALDELFGDDEGSEAEAARRAATTLSATGNVEGTRASWLLRMITTRAAGREKLALFLHDHFATSVEKVGSAKAMWQQIELLREKGVGPFADLVLAVARDPAMLVWLDANQNRVGRPNENFARELFELFTLGVGHYGEADVQEAARAFSGWHEREGRFWFNSRAHDRGVKRVLGKQGELGGEDVVALSVEHDRCPEFLAEKLARQYVADDPSSDWVERIAGWLRETELSLASTLRRMFRDESFYADELRCARILGPVEWAVGIVREVGGRVRPKAMARFLGDMGQSLLAPPSVEGWPRGGSWVSSTTLLARDRFAHALAFGDGDLGAEVAWPRAWSGIEGTGALIAAVERAWSFPLDRAARAALAQVVSSATASERTSALAHAFWTLPDRQLG